MRYSDKAPKPVAGVPINLEYGNAVEQAVTDEKGNYSFESLPSGRFTISAEMPNNMGGGVKRSFYVPAHACSEQNFIANQTGQISGKLFNQQGQPVITAVVAVVPLGDSPKPSVNEAYTDAHGEFRLQHLPPGEYLLGVNVTEPPRVGKYLSCPFPPTYSPGVIDRSAATVIHVNGKQPVSGLELRLTAPLPRRTITGTVTRSDGQSAPGAFIELKDSEFPNRNVDLGTAGQDGRFVVTGVVGRRYSVFAVTGTREEEIRMQSDIVPLSSDNNGPVTLILHPQLAHHPKP
jgi:hypothetical protein